MNTQIYSYRQATPVELNLPPKLYTMTRQGGIHDDTCDVHVAGIGEC